MCKCFQLQIYSVIGSTPLNHISTPLIWYSDLVSCVLAAVGGSKNGASARKTVPSMRNSDRNIPTKRTSVDIDQSIFTG